MDLLVYGMLLYLLLVISADATCNHSDLEHESEIFQYLGCMGYSDLPICSWSHLLPCLKGSMLVLVC